MKRFLNILILFPCVLLCSFTWDVIDKQMMTQKLEEIKKQLKDVQNYSITVSHASFEDYTTNVPHEKTAGFFRRSKNNYHSFLVGVTTIQNANCKLVVDSAHGVIAIADPDRSLENTLTHADYDTYLSVCTAIKMMTIGKESQYRLEFSKENPLNAYEFSIGDKGFFSKITIFYNREIKKENNSVTKPRMEITFSNWKKNISFSKDEFDETKYVFKKGDQYFLNTLYAGKYKLLDQRVMTKQKN